MKFLAAVVLGLVLVLFVSGGSASAADEAKPLKIIAGTALVEDIVRDLSGGRAEMLTLIPGSSCPGHNDLKALDLVFAARADLVIIHSFQQDLPQVKNMMTAVNRPGLVLSVVPVEGSWLVPAAQKEATEAVAAFLIAARPDEAEEIGARTARRLAAVDRLAEECLAELKPLRGQAVAVSARQAQFVRWAGLDPAAEYGRAEEMEARALARLIGDLKSRKLLGVIDNMQSGAEAGRPLARELGLPQVALSNFPGYAPEAADYFSLVRVNVHKLTGLAKRESLK